MSDLPASSEKQSITSDKSAESTDSYVEPILCVLGSDGQIIDNKEEGDESFVYNILMQASKPRKSIVDTLHHNSRHLSFQAKTLRKSFQSKRSSRDLSNIGGEEDDDDYLLFITKKSVHNINTRSMSALSLPRVSLAASRATSYVAVDENVYNRFEELDENEKIAKKRARKVKIVAENESGSITSSQTEKPEKVLQSYVYDPGQTTEATSKTPEEAQLLNLRETFLEQPKSSPFKQQVVQSKERASTSKATARERDRDRELEFLGSRILDKKPKGVDVKPPSSPTPKDTPSFLDQKKEPPAFRQQVLVQKDRASTSRALPRGREKKVDLIGAKVSDIEPKEVERDQLLKDKPSDVKPPSSQAPEVTASFLDQKKEPPAFKQQVLVQKDRVGSSKATAKDRDQKVEAKVSDIGPKGVVERKPSIQKGVKPRESPQQLKEVVQKKSSDIQLADAFLAKLKEPPPFRQQVLQQKDRVGPSKATAKDRDQKVEVKVSDIGPKGVIERKPSVQKGVERDLGYVKPRESPQQLKEVVQKKSSDIQLADAFLAKLKEPPPFRQQVLQQKDRVGPSKATPKDRDQKVEAKVSDMGPKGVVERKPSIQKGVERDLGYVKPRESPQQLKEVAKKKSSDIKLPKGVVKRTPSKLSERSFVYVKSRESAQQVREISKKISSDLKLPKGVGRDIVNVRESPLQVKELSKSVKSKVPVKISERKPSYVPLQKFDDVKVTVKKSKNEEIEERFIKAIEADDSKRVWNQHGILEEGEETPLAESTILPTPNAEKIDDADKQPRVQVDFNASVLESRDINYLSRLPIVTKTEQPYVPVLYTFRVKPKDNRKLEHLTTQAPPFYVLLDHTIAVIWTLFNSSANKEGLGIAQLQWAMYFLQQIHTVDGVPPKDVNLCIEAIQEYLIDEYSDISEESVMYGGACLGDYIHSPEKDIPFSLNYAQMIEKSVAMEEEEPLKSLDKELLEEFENVKRLVGIESIDLTTAISRDKTIIALNDWKREQIDKIQDELKLLRTVEDMMKSVDDTLVNANEEDELTILFNANRKS